MPARRSPRRRASELLYGSEPRLRRAGSGGPARSAGRERSGGRADRGLRRGVGARSRRLPGGLRLRAVVLEEEPLHLHERLPVRADLRGRLRGQVHRRGTLPSRSQRTVRGEVRLRAGRRLQLRDRTYRQGREDHLCRRLAVRRPVRWPRRLLPRVPHRRVLSAPMHERPDVRAADLRWRSLGLWRGSSRLQSCMPLSCCFGRSSLAATILRRRRSRAAGARRPSGGGDGEAGCRSRRGGGSPPLLGLRPKPPLGRCLGRPRLATNLVAERARSTCPGLRRRRRPDAARQRPQSI